MSAAVSPYFLSAAGLATVRAHAAAMGARLRALRTEREVAAVLARAALPALPAFSLPVLDERARDFLADQHARSKAARFLP